MTHGTIHVIGDEMTIVLHTTHDGHTDEAFVDCACMPMHLWRMLGGKEWWGTKSIRENKTLEKVNEYMHSLIPLRTDVLSFSSWVVGMKCGFWFPLPHKGADEATLEYFGLNSPDVVVTLSDERLPMVTVMFGEGNNTEEEEWEGIKKTIKKRMGKEAMKGYGFNDGDRTVEYRLDLVFAHMAYTIK